MRDGRYGFKVRYGTYRPHGRNGTHGEREKKEYSNGLYKKNKSAR